MNKNSIMRLVKKLGNSDSVEISRSEVFTLITHGNESVGLNIQQLLLTEIQRRKEELILTPNFNYIRIEEILKEEELNELDLSYLLAALFGG